MPAHVPIQARASSTKEARKSRHRSCSVVTWVQEAGFCVGQPPQLALGQAASQCAKPPAHLPVRQHRLLRAPIARQGWSVHIIAARGKHTRGAPAGRVSKSLAVRRSLPCRCAPLLPQNSAPGGCERGDVASIVLCSNRAERSRRDSGRERKPPHSADMRLPLSQAQPRPHHPCARLAQLHNQSANRGVLPTSPEKAPKPWQSRMAGRSALAVAPAPAGGTPRATR